MKVKVQINNNISAVSALLCETNNCQADDQSVKEALCKALTKLDAGSWVSSLAMERFYACSKVENDEQLGTVVRGFLLAVNKLKLPTAMLDASALLKYRGGSFSLGIQYLVHIIEDCLYELPAGLKLKNDPIFIKQVDLKIDDAQKQEAQEALKIALATAEGSRVTKDLGNLPSNIANSTYILNQVKELCAKYPTLTMEKVVDEAEMKKNKMGAFIAVNQGSAQPPYLVILKYTGAGSGKSFGLLGKGLTFDSGGISLKPAERMGEMKYDMCGAAAVIGTLVALAEAQAPVNVVGALALAENMPSGTAGRPGDIVTTMSGKTVEINNTDAEGRLVLSDSLTYLQRNYELINLVDMATLTGSVVTGLGNYHTGLFSNDETLAGALKKSSDETGDLLWRLPLHKKFHEQMKTNHADLTNTGGRPGGVCTAAAFLEEFVEEGTKWAHLDIAGTASIPGKDKNATGRPVRLLVNYYLNNAKI